MASATEGMDEDAEDDDEIEERAAMGLAPLGEGRPSSLGVGVGAGLGLGGRGGPGRDADVPRLFELSDELGGQGASGLRWSQLAIFDDQVRGLCFRVVLLVLRCFCARVAFVSCYLTRCCGVCLFHVYRYILA